MKVQMAAAVTRAGGLLAVGGVVVSLLACQGASADAGLLKNRAAPFPLILYSVNSTLPYSDRVTAEFPAIAEAGFTVVHSYQFEDNVGAPANSPEAVRGYLDAARGAGLKVLLSVVPQEPIGKRQRTVIRKRVSAFKDHRALFGWHLYDEPDNPESGIPPKSLKLAYQTIKRVDRRHPVSIASCCAPVTRRYPYANGFDVYMPDIYPIPPEMWLPQEIRLESLATWWDAAIKVLAPKGKILVPHIQIYSMANDPLVWPKDIRDQRTIYGRYPTRDEIRFMAYAAIVHGARGLSFCCYRFDYAGEYGPPEKEDVGPEANPDQWSRIRDVTRELRAVSPILDAPNARQAVRVESERGKIELLLKKYRKRLYLFALNARAEPTSATFRLPRSIAQVKVLDESRSIAPSDVSFQDSFGDYQVHIYEIQ